VEGKPTADASAAAHYREQIETFSSWNDTMLALRFGEARPYVKELCEIEGKLRSNWRIMSDSALALHDRKEKLIQILLLEYPEAAKELGLPLVKAIPEPSAAEGKSTNAAAAPRPEDVKVKQGNAVAEFGDVLTAVGGRSGGWISAALGPGGKRKNRGGRPRKDSERRRVDELRGQKRSWGEIQNTLNHELNQNQSKDAYRALATHKSKPRP